MKILFSSLLLILPLNLSLNAKIIPNIPGVFKGVFNPVPPIDVEKLRREKEVLTEQIKFYQYGVPDSPGRNGHIQEKVSRIDAIEKQLAAATH